MKNSCRVAKKNRRCYPRPTTGVGHPVRKTHAFWSPNIFVAPPPLTVARCHVRRRRCGNRWKGYYSDVAGADAGRQPPLMTSVRRCHLAATLSAWHDGVLPTSPRQPWNCRRHPGGPTARDSNYWQQAYKIGGSRAAAWSIVLSYMLPPQNVHIFKYLGQKSADLYNFR